MKSFIHILVVILVSCSVASADLFVGASKELITPNPLLPVSGGMGPASPATKKRDELTARAVVFKTEKSVVAIVSVDVLGFPSVLGDRARSLVRTIPHKNILIGATHTHSAPDCYAFPDGKGGHTGNLKYMDSICQKIAKAINQATANLQPARLRIATGQANGKIAYNYYAPDLYDRRVSVIQAVTSQTEPIVTLVNYAVHPEVLGANVGIVSPDLVGPMCARIEAKFGGMALFMNGAVGGMVTADNRDLKRPRDSQRGYWHDDRVWEECVRIGHLLADESLRVIKDAPFQTNPPVECFSADVEFPVDSDAMWAVVKDSPLKYPHSDNRTVTAQVNLINIGDSQILTIPGEALPNIGFYLKRKMKGSHNLLFGLTNDAFGYILTKVDFNSFPRYDYVSRVSLGEMTGEIYMEHALKLSSQHPPNTRP